MDQGTKDDIQSLMKKQNGVLSEEQMNDIIKRRSSNRNSATSPRSSNAGKELSTVGFTEVSTRQLKVEQNDPLLDSGNSDTLSMSVLNNHSTSTARLDKDGQVIKGHSILSLKKTKRKRSKISCWCCGFPCCCNCLRPLCRPLDKVLRVFLPGSVLLSSWDLVIVIALLYTAFVVPIEVAFVTKTDFETCDSLCVVNYVFNAIFIADFFLQFNLSFVGDDGFWVVNHWTIAKNYVSGWFTVDLLSIIPFDLIVYEILVANSSSSEIDSSQFRALKLIRLLRLIKLLRLIRASRLFKRYEVIFLQYPFSTLELIRCMFLILFSGHLIACAWGIVGTFTEDLGCNWITKAGIESDDIARMYGVALHWSMMTITSVGYGDAGIPCNTAEYYLDSLLMVLCGCIWAYIIGNVAAVFATMNLSEKTFRNNVDVLNSYLRNRRFDKESSQSLRFYMLQAKEVQKEASYNDVLDLLSPGLQSYVAYRGSRSWMRIVPLLQNCSHEFLAEVARFTKQVVYPPLEQIRDTKGRLCFISNGTVLLSTKRVLNKGKSWGNDMLLQKEFLIDMPIAQTMSFVTLIVLEKDDILKLLELFPDDAKIIKRFCVKTALRRYLTIIQAEIRIRKARQMSVNRTEIENLVRQGSDKLFYSSRISPEQS